jgi:hypothetical protein
MGSMFRMRIGSLAVTRAALLASAVVPFSVARGQGPTRTLDEGTFLISRNGSPIGRESFRILQMTPSTGEAYRATAQVALGDRRIIHTLTCDSAGAPITYDVAVQGGSDPATRLQARGRPGRFSSMLRTKDGESTREYVVPAGVVILDDEVVHQLYFVTMRGRRSGSLTVLAPRTGVQAVATLENRGSNLVEIAGGSIQATHYVLTAPDFPRREFWTDAAGRVLRASIPERGILAQRDEPPR